MQNLKSKYEQQEMRASKDLWNRLEQKLDQTPAKEEKSKMVWLRYAAAILLIFCVGGNFWITNNKAKIKENPQLANEIKTEKTIEKNEGRIIKNNSRKIKIPEAEPQKLAAENSKNQIQNSAPEKEIPIKNEELEIIFRTEEKLVQNEIPKPKEKVKYVSSSDLLFGVEIDKMKIEKPKSAIGYNSPINDKNQNLLNPKSIRLFGITLYEKDSLTSK